MKNNKNAILIREINELLYLLNDMLYSKGLTKQWSLLKAVEWLDVAGIRRDDHNPYRPEGEDFKDELISLLKPEGLNLED